MTSIFSYKYNQIFQTTQITKFSTQQKIIYNVIHKCKYTKCQQHNSKPKQESNKNQNQPKSKNKPTHRNNIINTKQIIDTPTDTMQIQHEYTILCTRHLQRASKPLTITINNSNKSIDFK